MGTTSNFSAATPRKSSLNRLAESLAESCRAHLLREKWLLVPSYRVGQQWLDTVARAGQPLVNVRLKTPKSLALEMASPRLAAERRAVVSDLAGTVLVARLLERHRASATAVDSYLATLPPSFRLAENIHASLRDLRLAGLETLRADACEVAAKGRELAVLLAAYQGELQQRHLADYADVLRLAIAAPRVDALVFVPAEIRLSALEQQLLDALPAQHVQRLPVDETPSVSVEFLRAIGQINEVRGVLRRCLAAGMSLDQVELLHTDAATYVPLIFEETERLSDTPVVTFAEGIPARFSRPGRALAAWLAWQHDDFPQPMLSRMLQDGLLNWPGDIPTARLASRLRPLGIGFGRDRYLAVLDGLLASHEAAPAADEDGELPAEHRQARQQRRAEWQSLRVGIETLLAEIPRRGASQSECLTAAARFLRDRACCVTELDNYARVELLERIEQLAGCIGTEPVGTLDVRAWLDALPDEVHVAGSGPQPGRLHVAHLRSGGHSGRPYTFIVGLDTNRWPATGHQDPVILDAERERLSPRLPTAAETRENETLDFQRLMARLRGMATLVYCTRSLVDDREMFAAEPVLAAYRTASGHAEANETDLARLPVVSFAPAAAADCLDEADWWRWRLCAAGGLTDAADLVAARHPNLGRGMAAAAARAGDSFTEFDGFVPEAGKHDEVLSASRLQTLGTCPLRYFYRHVLKVEPPDELALETDRWLQPSEFGQLLHEVFYCFMRELVDAGQLPDAERDAPQMDAILREAIATWRQHVPPPSESVFRREERQLERATRTFLNLEAEFCRASRPRFLETAIGLPSRDPQRPGALDRTEPVALELPDGRVIQVRGYIDRIDEVGPGRYTVWDYKTFSPAKYAKRDPFDQGRIVQHTLYIAMAEACLGKKVEKFGFFFPGEAGRGERLEWPRAELVDGLGVVANLCALLAGGVFVPTNTTKDCEFCDYRICCGDLEAVTAAGNVKLRNTANTALAPLRELRPPKKNEKD